MPLLKPEKKVAQIVSISYAEVPKTNSWIDSIIINPDWTVQINFAAGKDWEIIQHELFSAKLQEDESKTDAGKMITQSLNITFQGNNKNILQSIMNFKSKPLILKINYSDGSSRIIGGLENPCFINILNINENFELKKEIIFNRNSKYPALFLE